MDIKQLLKTFKKEDFFNSVNLHIHSNYSDGVEDFDSLVDQAKKLNMKYISITDHNSVEGYRNSKYKNDSILIPGVEFDCFYKTSPLHILGLGVDVDHKELNKLCSREKNDFIRLLKSRHPKKVIDTIHQSGGIAILAHPCCSFVISLKNYIKSLKKLGLDGVEVYYPYERLRGFVKFSSRQKAAIITKELCLLESGGTDEHSKLIKDQASQSKCTSDPR